MGIDVEAIRKRRADWLVSVKDSDDFLYARAAARDIKHLITELTRLQAEVAWRPIDEAPKDAVFVARKIYRRGSTYHLVRWSNHLQRWLRDGSTEIVQLSDFVDFRLITPPKDPSHG